jgi:2-isopropylmalate synthase
MKKGDEWLANRVYSGVPADYFGRRQVIELGPMSGQSNVVYWLEERGISPTPELVEALFQACKLAAEVLPEEEALRITAQSGAVVGRA